MKKIINSIVAALILSIILTLFNPQWFFKDDARWTYQNDAARVDVKFGGHVKNGRINAEGADFQILQPAWLSNENYQGTCVHIPISYQNKRCQIKLTPKADEWGEDATLVIELKGKDFQHLGERRPAWVCFRNITLNGQNVAAEKVVWHNTPFALKYPLASSKITLAFEVCKPLATSDLAFVNLLLVFLAFLLLSLFFAPLRRAADPVLTFINRKDIVKALKDGYLHIDPVYRRSFWIIFGVICFAFGLHTIWYMWGNHDWGLLYRTRRWNDHAWEGRYMMFVVKAWLSNGIYLPFIHDMITFVTLALNAVLLCKYWQLEKRITYYVLCGLVLVIQPFTLSMVYFVNMTPEVFIGVTCSLVALLLSEKITMIGGTSASKKIVYSLIVIALVNFSLAMYPVLLNTIAVAFAGRLLVQSFDWDGSGKRLKSYTRLCVVSATNVILGVVSYILVISYILPARKDRYNTEMLPLDQIPERLGVLFKQSFHQLYEYDMPFLPQWILWVFLGFTIILIFNICAMGNIRQRIARLLLLFTSLYATQTAMIIAKGQVIDGRVELFGLVFFEVLVMMLVLTRLRKLHNLSVIAGTCIVFASVLHDLDCLRVWKLGFDAEKMLWNRVIARMEIQKEFNPAKKYEIVLIGESISTRPRYFTGRARLGYYMLHGAYDFSCLPFSAHDLYYPTHFRGAGYSPATARGHLQRDSEQAYEARLRRLYQAGVLQKAEVWPKPNGLIVWKNIILFVTDERELNAAKKRLDRESRKKQIQHG